MIYTVTLNPTLDYHLKVKKLVPGSLHRCEEPYFVAGGKGICVSMVLSQLGVPNVALGFVGGFVGAQVKSLLTKQGINCDFVQTDQNTRLNVKVDSKSETELNAPGPSVSKDSWQALLNQLNQLTQGDILVLSGSICGGLPNDPYQILAQAAKERGADFVLDTTAQNMMGAIALGPLFVKPNLAELEEITGKILTDCQQIEQAAKSLIQKGAQSVLVSMGGDGAMLVKENFSLYQKAPAGEVLSTIGSGDSAVAGMCAKIKSPDEEKLKFAVACGSASAFSKTLATKQQILSLYKKIGNKTL